MSWFQTVDERRLNDPRVRGSSTLAKLVWHHLHVGESATRIPGLARGGPATIGERLGEPAEAVSAALAELEARGAVEVDLGERIIYLVGVAADFARAARSAPTVLHWLKLASDLPRSPVAIRALQELAAACPAELPNGNSRLRCAQEWSHRIDNLDTSPRGPAEQAPPRPLAPPPDPPTRALAPAKESPRTRRQGPSEAPPRPLRGPSEAPPRPPGSGSRSEDVMNGRSRSRSKIQDLHDPLTPKGGGGHSGVDLGVVEEALEALRAGARRLGTDGPGPATRAELRALARLAGQVPDVYPRLVTMAQRQAERVARDVAAGKDVRHLLTLLDVVREWPRLVGGTHWDAPARAPPASGSRPAMLSAPK